MTIIGGKEHPRRPRWVWMMCDCCYQNFWSDLAVNGKDHFCWHCANDTNPLAWGIPSNWSYHDASYHGSGYGTGERS